MSRHAFCFRLQPECPLVADERFVAGGFSHDESADLAEPAVFTDERLGAGTAGLLASGDHKQHAGRIGEPISERDTSGNESRYAAFHVRRAAPVKLAVRDFGCKWVDRPGLRPEWHRVDMAGEAERQLGRRAAQTRKDLRPPVAEGNELDRKTGALQQARQSLRAGPFAAGRIDGIEADQFLRQFDR